MAQAVSLKLPAPWTDNIESWFHQVEAQFIIRKITDRKTKFHHVVSVLDSSIANRVSSILRNPPQDDPYRALKDALIAKYGLSLDERARAINAISNLGDSKPSEMMDHMLSLLGEHTGGLMFRFHFLTILPDYVRTTLSASSETDLVKLAEEADRIFLTGRPRPPSMIHSASDDITLDRVAATAPTTRLKRKPFKQPEICYYHSRFGIKAHKCTPPCAWNSGNSSTGQQQ